MPRRNASRSTQRRSPQKKSPKRKSSKRGKRLRLPNLLPSARLRRRWFKVFRRAPAGLQITLGVAIILTLWLALNWAYQVIRKPSELFFPISGVLHKTPTETWRQYAPIFRKHATGVITPDFLAALAQVEGSGNPIVRTYWRWSLKRDPFEMYRPASSAVGMYQITNGTFALARRYCIHDHVVVEDGPWNEPKSCWFNSLYTRVVPSHAVELTSAYLDRGVADTLRRQRIVNATLGQKQNLAAVIHLCGAGAGAVYARRGLRLSAGQRCGDHGVDHYVGKVNSMRRVFASLEATTRP